MRIFISWSGPRSRKVAEYLSGWLRKLPLTVRPWVSKDAIDPGTRWEKELAVALEETRFGILCLTPENQLEPWICFESGALSKTVDRSHVIPYLIDMVPNSLRHPLKQFQAIEATKEGTLKLVQTIHKASGDDAHSMEDIKETFEALWPKLEENIKVAKDEVAENAPVKEADLPEIKDELAKIVAILESLSSRMTKLETKGLQMSPESINEIITVIPNPYHPSTAFPTEISSSKNIFNGLVKEARKKLSESETESALEQLNKILKGIEKKKVTKRSLD